MAEGPHLNLTLLGGFRLTINQQPQTAINQPQQQVLLAYLVLHTHAPQLRRQVAFLFWPDSSEARAYANLRRALHKLRHDCPAIEHFLVSTSTTLAWQRTPTFTLDVLTYESLLEQAAASPDPDRRCRLLQQSAACYRGELLPGCYDEWLLAKREDLNQQQLQLLHQLVDGLASAGDHAAAIHYAGELCRHDPFREESYRRLMTLHEANDDRAAALRIYHDCVAMLERELGIDPGPETQAIYQRLLKHSVATVDVKPSPVHSNTTRIPRLVGRAVELQQLQTAWRQASTGEPHLLLIQGEAGIGKTHLAEAFLSWGRQRNHLAIQTRAYAAEGQLS
ncbi:MAG: AAA family ATPase, partial [Caldilineaceae bacterium]|nr:AAA family ATPase [Caldilineaceae bacterium]